MELPKLDFYQSNGIFSCYCKNCTKKKAKASYTKPDKAKTKAYILKCRFGLSLEDYHSLYKKQSGSCAICNKALTLYAETRDLSSVACIDHNHSTGEVRGLLCNTCNTGIGMLKEDPIIMQSAIKYLQQKGVK